MSNHAVDAALPRRAERFFTAEPDRSVLVVTPQSNLLSLTDPTAQKELSAMLAQLEAPGVKHVVVDFGRLMFFNSSMLEALRSVWMKVKNGGGKMTLCNLSSVTREIVETSRLHTLWPVCSSRAEAMRGLNAPK